VIAPVVDDGRAVVAARAIADLIAGDERECDLAMASARAMPASVTERDTIASLNIWFPSWDICDTRTASERKSVASPSATT
jgi:hypothetical protein